MTDSNENVIPDEEFETDPASLVALIVGEAAPEDLTRVLHQNGWDVRHCPGPRVHRCPLVDGGDCPLRERSDAAVIHAETELWADPVSAATILRCAAHPAAPAVLLNESVAVVTDPPNPAKVITGAISTEELAERIEELHRRTVEN